MIIKRQTCFSNTNTFLGKRITFEGGVTKPGFDISKLKVTINDFYKDILDYDKHDNSPYKLTPQNIKSRVKVDEVLWKTEWNNPGKVFLDICFVDSKTGLYYSFRFNSPSDPVEVEYCYD